MSVRGGHDIARIAAVNPVCDPVAVADPHTQATIFEQITTTRPPSLCRRRRLHRRHLAAVMGVCAAVTAVGLGLGADHGSVGLPAAAQALAEQATAPILHTVRTEPRVADAAGGPAIVQTEMWAMRDGSQTRTKTTYADGTFQDLVLYRDGDRYRVDAYWSKDHRLQRDPWQPSSRRTPPSGPLFNIAERFAQAVQSGQAKVIGQTTVDGTPAYRISSTDDPPAPRITWTIANDREHPRLFSQQICLPQNRCQTTTYDLYEISHDATPLSLPHYPAANANP